MTGSKPQTVTVRKSSVRIQNNQASGHALMSSFTIISIPYHTRDFSVIMSVQNSRDAHPAFS